MSVRLFSLTLMLLSVVPSVLGATPDNDTDLWLVLRGHEASQPIIVSARQALPSIETRKSYVTATTLEWRYPVKGKGMPSDELRKDMYSFEEQVDQALVKTQLALLAVTRTGNGIRRWVYYLPEGTTAITSLNDLVAQHKGKVKVVSVTLDPEWQSLSEILAGVKPK